jgi:hypothetical protein
VLIGRQEVSPVDKPGRVPSDDLRHLAWPAHNRRETKQYLGTQCAKSVAASQS